MRDEAFRVELVSRYRGLRERIAALYQQRLDELGIESPLPVGQVTTMVFAMANGFAMEKLLEPEAVDGDFYATMVGVFLVGLQTSPGEAARSQAISSSPSPSIPTGND
jgi:hypothetical protein